MNKFTPGPWSHIGQGDITGREDNGGTGGRADMSRDELRTHFDLKPCPNPHHEFHFMRLVGEWVWAEDKWAQLVEDRLQTLYLSFQKLESTEGTKCYSLVAGKLKIIWGWLDAR